MMPTWRRAELYAHCLNCGTVIISPENRRTRDKHIGAGISYLSYIFNAYATIYF
jgi:hypothetical protein